MVFLGASATWTGAKMLYYGGQTGESSFGGAYLYDQPLDGWRQLLDAPPAQGAHTAVWTGREVIIWGGILANVGLSFSFSGQSFDPATNAWHGISTAEAPTRSNQAVWADGAGSRGTGLLLVEGSGGGGAYDPLADRWMPTSRRGAPTGVSESRPGLAVWTGHRLLLWHSKGGAMYQP
jgi:hypothetical protein